MNIAINDKGKPATTAHLIENLIAERDWHREAAAANAQRADHFRAVAEERTTQAIAELERSHRLARRCADQAEEIARLHDRMAGPVPAAKTPTPVAAMAAIATMQRTGIR